MPPRKHCPPAPYLFRFGIKIAIIGGGPAGLRAAEVAASRGATVTLFDAKPSVGRKFLVAGRGGLNLTHSEPRESFGTRYSGPGTPADFWPSVLADFDSDALRAWASGLGVETFVGTSGRVFPREFKAAPLLRRWVERLRKLGVHFALRHRWTGLRPGARVCDPQQLEQHGGGRAIQAAVANESAAGHGPAVRECWQLDFHVEGELRTFEADAVILALGGGSWPETGSDGGWVEILQRLGVAVAPLVSANCGWELPWCPALLVEAEGKQLKNITASAAATTAVGELVVTRYGLEGGAIYQLGPVLRAMVKPEIVIDLKPSFTVEQLVAKLGTCHRNFLAEARSRWRLSDAAFALLKHLSPPDAFTSAAALAAATKTCRLRLTSPRPLAEAISSAGGVCWNELNEALMLRRLPGVFVAGEMIDWEAPTGGYLMQGCFATGTRAASGAVGLAIQM